MKTKKERIYSLQVKEAVALLGKYVQLGRKERQLTENDLADRAGISRTTLQKIEKGDPKCEIGLFFEVATIVDVVLFNAESTSQINSIVDRVNDKIALLPKSIRKKKKQVDDVF